MITVTLNSDEMRDVIYALNLAADDLRRRANPLTVRGAAADRVRARIDRVRIRIEVNASGGYVGGRCAHGVAFRVPCFKCQGILKGE